LSPPSTISLVGFMGSGKSTVGALLAARLGRSFADSDRSIATSEKMPIAEIFRTRGEAAFREMERATVARLLETPSCVISTGGGVFANDELAEALLSRSFVAHLHCEFEEALRRASLDPARPLLERGVAEAKALYERRKDKYARAHVTVDATHRTPDQVVEEILSLLPKDE
jgi:shikimate kinase